LRRPQKFDAIDLRHPHVGDNAPSFDLWDGI